MQKHTFSIGIFLLCVALVLTSQFGLLDNYVITVLMFVGINIIMSTSLNLVNGNMGEFSCGHAAFMCVGAYVSSILSVLCFGTKLGAALLGPNMAVFVFPIIVLIGGVVAALAGIIVALPSFKTRGDYLAIITIAVNYMIISAIDNMDFIGGSRGFQGMKDTVWAMVGTADIPWMFIWTMVFTIFTIWIIRRFISSTYGKGVNAICQDEIAAEIMSVNTNRMKLVNFMLSSGLAGIAGGLFAHVVGYVNPHSFDILKSTEALVMVYLGGMGSLSGAVLAAILFTGLMEVLRFTGVFKWVIIPLILVLLMQFRPEGIMGNRELTDLFPKLKKYTNFK